MRIVLEAVRGHLAVESAGLTCSTQRVHGWQWVQSAECRVQSAECSGRAAMREASRLTGEHHRHRAAHTLGVLALGDELPARRVVEGQREVVVGRVGAPRWTAEEADEIALVHLPRALRNLVVAVK